MKIYEHFQDEKFKYQGGKNHLHLSVSLLRLENNLRFLSCDICTYLWIFVSITISRYFEYNKFEHDTVAFMDFIINDGNMLNNSL